ncbi:sensor histidine kinase [Microcoleus asticus]|uniref:Oxygen sensor histidine kinase NreB n=1 Tax=Microcoleus asticus IPMA8 TaxID=2563858 RepID=A0ABX2D4W4_9CYAN|nr:sensor histidine kinase [Microcoleus asticus]NQE37659.1 Sensor histidine kinase LiaS [Microcoleus asticus IPMA8]
MIRLTYPSFRLLLYLEWLLLATAALMEVLHPFHSLWSLLLRVGAIALFGALGLRLPTVRLGRKVLFTALEFGLILLPIVREGLSSRSSFLLFLVLLMRSCLIFRQPGQVTVLGLALLSYSSLLLLKPILPEKVIATVWEWRFSNVLLFGLTLVFALLLINALIAERQSREQLEIAHDKLAITHEQLRHYALRIEDQATLQERNRIAREIHDGLGHTLAAQTIQLNNALLFWKSEDEKALGFLKQAKQLGSEALLEIRKSVSVLRSNPLQGLSLESAIDKLLQDFQRMTAIEVSNSIRLPVLLSQEINTTLYRIVQESLTNIHKHADATVVTVGLQQHAGQIYLSIADNGKGFDPAQNTTGFGLQGMRERVAAAGGQFAIYSKSENGCRISVSLPSQNI